MNTEDAKKLLVEKERSLVKDKGRLQGELAGPDDVGDPVDNAVVSEETGDASEQITRVTDTLKAVRAALQRIEDGTYGRCVICGRPIEPKRLEAVPWTLYCLEDQEKIDRQGGMENAIPTL